MADISYEEDAPVTATDVYRWATEKVGIKPVHANKLYERSVNGNALVSMNLTSLKSIGIPIGPGLKIVHAAKRYGGPGVPGSATNVSAIAKQPPPKQQEFNPVAVPKEFNLLKASENRELMSALQKYFASEKQSDLFMLAIDITNFRSMVHSGDESIANRAARIYHKMPDAGTGLFSQNALKTLSTQITRKEVNEKVFDQISAELQTALQQGYTKFVNSSTSFYFGASDSHRRTMEMRPIILSEDVPPNFSEDALSKCQELMQVFREFLRSKKIENFYDFYVEVYNYKVRIFNTYEQEVKRAKFLGATWLGIGSGTPLKVELPKIDEMMQRVAGRITTNDFGKDLFQEIYKEVGLKLQAQYQDFIKTHNIKSIKSGALAKLQKKLASE